jgi:hypothetical protein
MPARTACACGDRGGASDDPRHRAPAGGDVPWLNLLVVGLQAPGAEVGTTEAEGLEEGRQAMIVISLWLLIASHNVPHIVTTQPLHPTIVRAHVVRRHFGKP